MADMLTPEAQTYAKPIDLVQNHKTLLRRKTEETGAAIMAQLTDDELKDADEYLRAAKSPEEMQSMARDILARRKGPEVPFWKKAILPSGGAVIGGMLGGPPGARAGAVLGQAAEMSRSGRSGEIATPGGALELGLTGLFGNMMNKNPITATLGKSGATKALNQGLNQVAMHGATVAANNLVDPVEHPIGNIAANFGLFGAGALGLQAATNKAKRIALQQVERGAALPSVSNILNGERPSTPNPYNPLANETGAVSMSPGAVSAAGAALWEKAAGSKIQAGVDYLSRLPLFPGNTRLGRYLGGNTLEDLFVPREELMPRSVGRSVYNTRIEQAKVAQSLQDIQVKIQSLPLDMKEDFYRVVKGGMDITQAKNPANQAVFANMLDPYFAAIGDAKKKLMPKARHEALYRKQLDDSLVKLLAEDIDNPEFQIFKNSWRGDLTTEKGTQEFLNAIITNQHTMFPSEQVTQLAKDLYDLGARTGSQVVTKHKGAFEALLFSKIKAQPGVAIPIQDIRAKASKIVTNPTLSPAERKEALRQLDKNYMHIPGNKAFEGMLVERHTAEGIKDLDIAQSAFRRNWNTYFLSPWKFAKAIAVPINKARDMVSNMIFNDVAGAHPLSPFNIPVYKRALMDMKQNTARNKEFAYYSGNDSTNWVNVEMGPIINAMKHGSGPIDIALKHLYDNKFSKLMYDASSFMDHWAKLAKYSHNVDNGMSKADAAIDAIQTVGDHMRQTRATKAIRDTAMPFFGFQVHAIKTMGQGLIHHPVRTAKYFAGVAAMGQMAIEKLGLSEEEWKEFRDSLPDHLKVSVAGIPTAIPMPYRDENGKIQMVDMSWWIPGLQDMAEMQRNSSSLSFMQNPAITLFADLRANKKFSGAPIWNEWEDPTTKAQKLVGHVMQNLTPSWTPVVGTTWDKTVQALDEDYVGEDKRTVPQALGNQFGWRVTPIDEAGQFTKNQNRIDAWKNEAKNMMNKELSKTQNPDKMNAIIENYQGILDRLDREAIGEK